MAMATTLPLHAIARFPSLPLSNCRTFNLCQGRARRLHGLKGSIKAAMAAASDTTSPWVEFPRLSPAGKRLMEAVADSMDRELGTSLRPSRTDPEVVSFKGQSGEGSVTLRAGREGSKVCSNVFLIDCFRFGILSQVSLVGVPTTSCLVSAIWVDCHAIGYTVISSCEFTQYSSSRLGGAAYEANGVDDWLLISYQIHPW